MPSKLILFLCMAVTAAKNDTSANGIENDIARIEAEVSRFNSKLDKIGHDICTETMAHSQHVKVEHAQIKDGMQKLKSAQNETNSFMSQMKSQMQNVTSKTTRTFLYALDLKSQLEQTKIEYHGVADDILEIKNDIQAYKEEQAAIIEELRQQCHCTSAK